MFPGPRASTQFKVDGDLANVPYAAVRSHARRRR
jgi:hypothetical protein